MTHDEPSGGTSSGAAPQGRPWLLRGTIAILAAGCVAWVVLSWSEPSSSGRPAGDSVIQQYAVEERENLGAFDGTLLDGGEFHSADLDGRVAVYNVWGSWCVPCRTEAPDLISVAQEYEDNVSFIGINVRDGLDAARAFERRQEVPYPSVRAEDSSDALLAFGDSASLAAVPTSLVVDREGRIAARIVGPTTYATLRALVADVVAEP